MGKNGTCRSFPSRAERLAAALLLLSVGACRPAARPSPRGPKDRPRVALRRPAVPTTPRGIVERAIRVSGGLQALRSRLGAYAMETRGTFHGAPYKMRSWWRAPDRLINRISSWGLAQAMLGRECWDQFNDVVQDCEPGEKKTRQRMSLLNHFSTLYPLVGAECTLAKGDPARVRGRWADGVEVTSRDGLHSAVLHFDRASGRLVRVTYTALWSMTDALMQVTYLKHRWVDGVLIGSETKMTMDGKVVARETVTRITTGRVDPARFRRPAQVALGAPRLRREARRNVIHTIHRGAPHGLVYTTTRMLQWMVKNDRLPLAPPEWIFLSRSTRTMQLTEVRVWTSRAQGDPSGETTFHARVASARTIAALAVRGDRAAALKQEPALKAWIQRQGLKVTGPLGMVVYMSTGPPAAWIRDLYYPVGRSSRPAP